MSMFIGVPWAPPANPRPAIPPNRPPWRPAKPVWSPWPTPLVRPQWPGKKKRQTMSALAKDLLMTYRMFSAAIVYVANRTGKQPRCSPARPRTVTVRPYRRGNGVPVSPHRRRRPCR